MNLEKVVSSRRLWLFTENSQRTTQTRSRLQDSSTERGGTAGGQNDSREPALKSREVKKMLKDKLKMGPAERPYCFIFSDTRESYFCRKSDLPNGATDGATLQFDAMPSFDKKKNQESWKAVNVRTM